MLFETGLSASDSKSHLVLYCGQEASSHCVVHSIEMEPSFTGFDSRVRNRPGTDKRYLYCVGDLFYCSSLSHCISVSGVVEPVLSKD